MAWLLANISYKYALSCVRKLCANAISEARACSDSPRPLTPIKIEKNKPTNPKRLPTKKLSSDTLMQSLAAAKPKSRIIEGREGQPTYEISIGCDRAAPLNLSLAPTTEYKNLKDMRAHFSDIITDTRESSAMICSVTTSNFENRESYKCEVIQYLESFLAHLPAGWALLGQDKELLDEGQGLLYENQQKKSLTADDLVKNDFASLIHGLSSKMFGPHFISQKTVLMFKEHENGLLSILDIIRTFTHDQSKKSKYYFRFDRE